MGLYNLFPVLSNGLFLPHHSHTEDGGLGLGGTTLGLLRLLALMLVGLTATKVHLIALNNPMEIVFRIVLLKEGANLMQNEPSGLLRDMDISGQLNGRNALLVAGDKVHRNEPLGKGNLRVLEDGSNEDGEILFAVRATEGTVLAGIAMMLTAEGANNIVLLPTGVTDGTDATLFGGEESRQFDNGVETREVNHKAQVQVVSTYIYHRLGPFLHKKPMFFAENQ